MAVAPRRVRPQQVIQEEAVSVVSVQSSSFGIDESERQSISVHQFVTDPAYVEVHAGFTRNLTNFEFLRIDVSLRAPCYVEEANDVAPRVADWVAQRLDEEIQKYDQLPQA